MEVVGGVSYDGDMSAMGAVQVSDKGLIGMDTWRSGLRTM